uniref:Uncharacterized protein n=1 Tax=Chlamydomonas leiostraca TaxID=1034604 RepID=A0A7S0RXL8_9CHLO|mmetsp:Transcript_34320/g.86799  ORF Transcript_34320/g.86799 Transcript_34320/m.86799 type:complete len:313 (+) Transcript_34320:147-1085(+)|eukprot:CAMPEP_0202866860 /NCGR_PEP_ID=MMETSP1391-20130828/8399_1 /ASSEMBLY_ACC=CAM_ASM_000867 /TAXON_ID=1034604 /ORGANISM="Chlamydomonas leiostraca, Strain SAG 11-49" /LENGTH=312 /DNA_ID=CAMNT_0049546847 /DNA_START=145 /DNA_END=1083 /DNA_ORIENTATION=-
MDAITRISSFFPTNTITVYIIMSNVIISNSNSCEPQQRQLMIALLVIFCILNLLACFSDTYTASNGQKFWVFIMPFYGPLCFSLPSDYDKDRVYEFYYLKIRDYIHAFISMLTFLLIIIFTNPICMCLFPNEDTDDGTSRLDAAIVRTVPVVVAIIMAMLMVCLGPPRQMLGFQNVPETAPVVEAKMGDNPIYNKGYPPPPYSRGGPPAAMEGGSIPEGEMEGDYDDRPPLEGPPSKLYPQGSRDNYPSARDNMPPRDYNRPPSSRGEGGYRTPPHDYPGRGSQRSYRERERDAGPRNGGGGGDRDFSDGQE